jgi:hypothetical protein
MNNLIIRSAMLKTGIRAWQVAKYIMKVSDPTFYRKMRDELPESEQLKIATLIEEYAQKGGQDHDEAANNG